MYTYQYVYPPLYGHINMISFYFYHQFYLLYYFKCRKSFFKSAIIIYRIFCKKQNKENYKIRKKMYV